MKCFTNSLTLVCFLLASFYALHLSGQNQLLYWGLPDSYYDFSGNSISSLPTSTNNPNGPWGYEGEDVVPSNMIYDDAGDLIFFIANNAVYDSDGKLIGAFILTSNNWTRPGASNAIEILDEVTIVPIDKCSNKFHIIANRSKTNTSARTTAGVLWYTLDMNESWNEPDLAPNGKLLFKDELVSPTCTGIHCGYSGIAVSPQRTDGSYFLYTFSYEGFQKFDINGNNITEDNNFDTGLYNISNQSGTYASEAELYYNEEDGSYKFAYVARPGERNSTVTIWNLDSDGMADFSNDPPIELNPFASLTDPDEHSLGENVTGLEFSPDGEKLFLTATDENSTGISAIQYIDLSANPATLNDFSVSNENQYRFSFIELGQDGKIYIPGTTAIASLSSPNSPNTANWTASEINFAAPTKNDLNNLYPNRNYRLLPDQIDGQNYDNIVPIGYNAINYTATTSATWTPGAGSNPFGSTTGIVYISNILIIPKGIDIEIQNMDFRFGPEGRIIIENGNGTLEGGELTLTNTICQGVFCDETNTWKGIEVWGDPTQLNFGGLSGGKRRFGSILVQSSSQIKNAEIGILAASRQHAPTNNPKHGGLIEVESSSFINCQRGIEMRAHKYFNYSYIENNTFTINDSYDHTTQPEAHITLREVGRGFGIPITGNTLQDVRPTSVIPLNRAWGIYSLDSKFRVESCTLKTLRYGIYAVASIRTNTFFASNNLFDLNHRGLYARGIDYLSTIDNDFSVSGVWSYSYGEYLNGCSDFEVQRNDFYCNQDGTSPLGIIINESNGFDEIDANKIANNTFSDLFIGTSVYGDNDGVAGNPNDIPFLNPGLHILCGDYTNNYIDIYIPRGASINDPQGKCFEDSDLDDFPAGNTFSRTCVTTESDYFLGTGDDKPEVTTYWHNNDIAHTPDCHSTRLEPTNASCGNYNNECNTEYYESLELSRSIDTIKTKIQSASDSVSTIADTIIKGFWLGHQKWLASRAINHYLIIDSTESSLDSMKAISENERDFYGLAFQHLVESDSSKMHTYLDSIDNANDTIGRYFDSLYVYQTDTLFIEEIDTASSFFDYVNSAADDSSLTISKNAQTIVQRITNNFFEEPIIVPQDSSSKRGEPLAVHNEFEVYPNPTDNMIYLKDNSKSHQINRLHVQLINTVGERVYTGELTSFSNVMVLDVSGIASGLYVLQVYDKGRIIFTTKVSIL